MGALRGQTLGQLRYHVVISLAPGTGHRKLRCEGNSQNGTIAMPMKLLVEMAGGHKVAGSALSKSPYSRTELCF